MDSDRRLATYGSLAPGQPNHHQLDGLAGRWIAGTVCGDLRAAGWGAAMGYPGFIPNEHGQEVAVQIFESRDLPDHWDRLDAFEGDGYRRMALTVRTPEGQLSASIYVLRL